MGGASCDLGTTLEEERLRLLLWAPHLFPEQLQTEVADRAGRFAAAETEKAHAIKAEVG